MKNMPLVSLNELAMKISDVRNSSSIKLVKLLLGILAVLFLVWLVGSKDVLALISSVNPWLFLLLMLLSGVLIQISIIKWRLFLRF